ncbi:hypothetical protein QNI16_07130 [Cytophagaceae bacterium YF14B1]|uniref:Uncharacterized protein n=1 Tax=Xanthocytophaga flava TaxID=3048013 RepID=A0AAE3QNM6_9BACT|nr:hypothetical protein [Xanthocytophaga flavus]MDJ1480251.1 hypothetical protein [Xanthocytophaga flavus]
MKEPKELYQALSTKNRKSIREYVAGKIGVSTKTVENHLRSGLDIVETKHFFAWFEEQGIDADTLISQVA